MATPRDRHYPSDLADAQWALMPGPTMTSTDRIEPLLPAVNTGGRPEKHARGLRFDAVKRRWTPLSDNLRVNLVQPNP